MLIISMLHDILLLRFPVKMNMDVLKIRIEYKNFRRILGEREILGKMLGDFYENLGFSFFRGF